MGWKDWIGLAWVLRIIFGSIFLIGILIFFGIKDLRSHPESLVYLIIFIFLLSIGCYTWIYFRKKKRLLKFTLTYWVVWGILYAVLFGFMYFVGMRESWWMFILFLICFISFVIFVLSRIKKKK